MAALGMLGLLGFALDADVRQFLVLGPFLVAHGRVLLSAHAPRVPVRLWSCASCGWLHPTLAGNLQGHYNVNRGELVVNDLGNAVAGNRTGKTGRY